MYFRIRLIARYLDVNPTGADPQDFRLYSWSKTKGDAGRGIVSTVHYFLATAQGSGVTASSSGWTTTAQYPTETKRYLWNYTVTQYSDNTSQTSVPIIISVHGQKGDKGDPGNDGIAGRDGVGIRSTVVTYGLSSSDTVQPTSWSGSVPSLVKGQYLWTKTVWTYTDNRTEIGYQKTYISRDGNNGRDGIAGKDGVGIRSTTITYAASSSGTTAPSSGWVSNPPVVSAGQYLWTKTVWAYTDNSSETGYSVAKMGETGPKGEQGIQGLSYHLFTTNYRYNQTSISQYSTPGYTGTWVVNEDTGLVKIGDTVTMSVYHTEKLGLVYILATVKAIASDRSLTTVSKGLIDKGEKGIDGRTPYIHWAYSDNADGTGLTTSDNGQRYQGYYSDHIQADSKDKTKYRWVDRWAKIELGGRNYILQSDVYTNSGSKYFDVSQEFLDYAYSGRFVTISLDIKGENLVPDASGRSRIGCELRLGLSNGSHLYLQCQKIVSGNVPRQRISVTRQIPQGVSVTNLNKVNMYIQVGGTALAGRPKFELSSSPSDWSPATEDIETQFTLVGDRISEEAQRQAFELTKLQEQAQAMRVEIEAKALASEVKQWLAEYREFAQNSDRVTDDLTRSFFKSQERIVEMEHHLKENSLLLSFVNTYLRTSDDGVTLGSKDNSEYIQITPKGIQLMSAGVAVATVSNGLMKTAHGVLTDSLQVGHYRFEQSKRNAAINVWRYID